MSEKVALTVSAEVQKAISFAEGRGYKHAGFDRNLLPLFEKDEQKYRLGLSDSAQPEFVPVRTMTKSQITGV